jgi:hypothetical protein
MGAEMVEMAKKPGRMLLLLGALVLVVAGLRTAQNCWRFLWRR